MAFRKATLFLFLLMSSSLIGLWADPWGKDACMVPPADRNCNPPSPLAQVGVLLVRFHQEVISPVDGPRSHFLPSSSQYTLEAMRRYGFLTGVMMGCDRLLRENNEVWVYPTGEFDERTLKVDPVK